MILSSVIDQAKNADYNLVLCYYEPFHSRYLDFLEVYNINSNNNFRFVKAFKMLFWLIGSI